MAMATQGCAEDTALIILEGVDSTPPTPVHTRTRYIVHLLIALSVVACFAFVGNKVMQFDPPRMNKLLLVSRELNTVSRSVRVAFQGHRPIRHAIPMSRSRFSSLKERPETGYRPQPTAQAPPQSYQVPKHRHGKQSRGSIVPSNSVSDTMHVVSDAFLVLSTEEVSHIFGTMALLFNLLVYTPQLYRSWQTKSTEGISPAFILMWFVGDATNLLGSILTNGIPTQIFLATYYMVMEVGLIAQYLMYRPKVLEEKSTTSALMNRIGLGAAASTVGYFLTKDFIQELAQSHGITAMQVGASIGWLSTVVYMLARVPQLYTNYSTKNTGELSPYLFILTIMGNTAYFMSLVVYADGDPSVLETMLPWLVGSSIVTFLDLAILYQFWLYYQNQKTYTPLEDGASMFKPGSQESLQIYPPAATVPVKEDSESSLY